MILRHLRSASLAVALSAAGLAPSAVLAQASEPQAVVTHDDAVKTPNGKFVQDLGDNAIAVIADKKITKEQRSDRFRDILRNSFDLQTIGRFVLGRSWNAATLNEPWRYSLQFVESVLRTG